MGFVKPLCIMLSLILSFILGDSNVYKYMKIDVSEPDGKLVVWRESEYLEIDSYLTFLSSDDVIDRAYISYDNGKSYKPFLTNVGKELVINSKDFQGPFCIAFMNYENHVSKQFKINFRDCNTFT